MLQVQSKILNVSSGADLSSKGRELAQHFTAQGTPIMIGKYQIDNISKIAIYWYNVLDS